MSLVVPSAASAAASTATSSVLSRDGSPSELRAAHSSAEPSGSSDASARAADCAPASGSAREPSASARERMLAAPKREEQAAGSAQIAPKALDAASAARVPACTRTQATNLPITSGCASAERAAGTAAMRASANAAGVASKPPSGQYTPEHSPRARAHPSLPIAARCVAGRRMWQARHAFRFQARPQTHHQGCRGHRQQHAQPH
mmetsp:Transcript_18685/g.43571  ORF Transcript_18685/g.43571 Transcript_18685/m.43571 type:complete len:204 (-) Transcript_18685:4311-4922(-)